MFGFCGRFFTAEADDDRRSRLAAMAARLRRDPDAATHVLELPALRGGVAWTVSPTVPDHSVAWDQHGTALLAIAGDDVAAGTIDAAGALRLHNALGAAAFARLNGWFHGLLVDVLAGTVTVFNDRYGLARVYTHETARGEVCLASEAKALLAVHPELREIDPRGLAEVATLRCVLQDRTLFRGVGLLPPATAWTFRRQRVEKRTYFSPVEWEAQTALPPDAYERALAEVFPRAVGRCRSTAVPVGLSLTGGLDSRAVLAWARAEPGTLPCYTFGGPYRDCHDVRIARRLARLTQQPHTTIQVDDSFFAEFPALAEQAVRVSDGAMDVSGAVELFVNARARAIAPVRLTGNYGSEVLRANIALRPANVERDCYTPEFQRRLDDADATYAAEIGGHPLSFIVRKQLPWHHHGRFAVERAALTPRSPFLDAEVVSLAYRVPVESRGAAGPLLALIAAGNRAFAEVETDRALRPTATALVAAFATSWRELTVKAEYAYDYGMPEWLTKTDRALMPLRLERLFLGRHKFYHFRVWYRDRLGGYLRERLAGFDEERFGFRRGAVRALVDAHVGGRANHTLALHHALTLQLVDELLLRAA